MKFKCPVPIKIFPSKQEWAELEPVLSWLLFRTFITAVVGLTIYLYLTAPLELFRLDKHSWTPVTNFNGQPSALKSSANQAIWLQAKAPDSLYQFAGDTFKSFPVPSTKFKDLRLFEELVVISIPGGAAFYDGTQWHSYTTLINEGRYPLDLKNGNRTLLVLGESVLNIIDTHSGEVIDRTWPHLSSDSSANKALVAHTSDQIFLLNYSNSALYSRLPMLWKYGWCNTFSVNSRCES